MNRWRARKLIIHWNSEFYIEVNLWCIWTDLYRKIHLILIILQIVFFISLFVREILILIATGGNSIIDSPGWNVPFELAGILTSLMWLFSWYLRGADEKVRKSVRASLITIVIELVADMIMCLLSLGRMSFYWIDHRWNRDRHRVHRLFVSCNSLRRHDLQVVGRTDRSQKDRVWTGCLD